jgi:hypothetical protein
MPRAHFDEEETQDISNLFGGRFDLAILEIGTESW